MCDQRKKHSVRLLWRVGLCLAVVLLMAPRDSDA